MPVSTPWNKLAGDVTLDRNDQRLGDFADWFALVLGSDSVLLADTALVPGTPPVLAGRIHSWEGATATCRLSWDPATDRVRRVELARPHEAPAGLDTLGLTLSDVEDRLIAEVPAGGTGCSMSREIHGQLHVGPAVTLGFRAAGFGGSIYWLEFEPRVVETASDGKVESRPVELADLARLLGADHDPHGDLDDLPPELRVVGEIGLSDLQATIDLSDPRKLVSFSVTLTWGAERNWPLIPGFSFLSVQGISATLEVEHPLDADYRLPRVTVRGSVIIDGVSVTAEAGAAAAHVDLSARWPDLQIAGELRAGERLTVARLLERCGVAPQGLPNQDLAITELSFHAEPTSDPRTFSLRASVSDIWQLDVAGQSALQIKQLSLVLDYESGRTPTLSPAFLGQFGLGGLDVTLLAERDGDGWRFEGRTAAGQGMLVGEWIDHLSQQFSGVSVPAPVRQAELRNLDISFQTVQRQFRFSAEAWLPTTALHGDGPGSGATSTDAALDLTLQLEISRHEEGWQSHVTGELQLGNYVFDVQFTHGDATALVASYHGTPGQPLDVLDLLRPLLAGIDLPHDAQLRVGLKSALVASAQPADHGPSWKVCAIDIDGGLDLSNLPLVGEALPAGQSLSVAFQLLYASSEVRGDSAVTSWVTPVNDSLPTGVTPLPTVPRQPGEPVIAGGVSLSTKLLVGSESIELVLPVAAQASNGQVRAVPGRRRGAASPSSAVVAATPAAGAAPVAVDDGLKWFTIHKSFGPAHIERIGASCQGGQLTFAIDASVQAAGLTLDLHGLGVSTPLTTFAPTFSLRGLGIDYANGPVEIGGTFLRLGPDDFAGSAILRAKSLTLTALGAYSKVDGHPSMFVYAVLDYPLGGPSFFFVTGLAAGFGYNRSLIPPALEDVATFPFVAAALRGDRPPPRLTDELSRLAAYVPPRSGDLFLAVGVKFTSFNLIESFALVTVAFGHQFEIDVLGISTVVVPPAATGGGCDPLARVSLALLARFVPAEGLLSVQAQLTSDSFILSRNCHLTGGFAFCSWFAGDHAGDFVLTLGGYHPQYTVPDHYPQVPRLGFNWQVCDELVVKGEAYYALTPHALMAGGHLEASYHSGRLSASFNLGADFLISWQPYHYDAHFHVGISGSYRTCLGTLSVDVSADVHVWGPEFAGTAAVDIWIATLHVSFGNQDAQRPSYIDWPTFKQAFLPDAAAVVSLAVEEGLLTRGDSGVGHLGTLNARQLRLATNSLVPATTLQFGATRLDGLPSVGIASVNVPRGGIESRHVVSITRAVGDNAEAEEDVTDEFRFDLVRKDVPSALWGPPAGGIPPLNPTDRFIEDAVCGIRITPRNPPAALASHMIDVAAVEYEPSLGPAPPRFLPSRYGAVSDQTGDAAYDVVDTVLQDAEARARRDAQLAALGCDPTALRLAGFSARLLTVPPRLERLTGPVA